MKRSRLRVLRFMAGIILAIIPLSNFFYVLSNSSAPEASHEASVAESARKGARLDSPAAPGTIDRSKALNERFNSHARRAAAVSPFAAMLSATKSDALFTDVNMDGNADPGDTLKYTVTITNTGDMAATGVVFNDTIDPNTTLVPGSIKTTPLAANDSFNALGNVRIQHGAPGLLANDGDGDGDTITASGPATSANGGNVVVNANGSFSYNPAPGFEGTDSFTYTISDGNGGTDTATVTISVNEVIWFIDDSAGAGGDGRLTNPFDSLSDLGSAADDPGDFIFLYSGAYTGPHMLLNDQKLIGQGVDLTAALSPVTAPPGSDPLPGMGTAPTITSAADGIILALNNRLSGFTVGNTGGTDIVGNTFGNLTVSSVRLDGTGRGVNLVGGNFVSAIFTHISSTGAPNGIFIKNTTGAFSVAGSGGAGTGGTIATTVGADGTTDGIGVYLENATSISLSGMQINDHPNFAIRGISVSGFTLSNSIISGTNGTNANALVDEASVAFSNLVGSASITNSQISGGLEDNFRVANSAGILNRIIFDVVTIGANSTLEGGDGILIDASGTAVVNATIEDSFFTSTRADHFQFNLNNTATGDLDFLRNAIIERAGGNHGRGRHCAHGRRGRVERQLYLQRL